MIQRTKSFGLFSAFFVLALLPNLVAAEPYSTSYTSEIANPVGNEIPGLNAGEPFTVTVVFDNGGSSAVNQTWSTSNVTCVNWIMNEANDVSFSHNVTLDPLNVASGQATTDAGGALTGIFSQIIATDITAGSYTQTGLTVVDPTALYYLNDLQNILSPDGWTTYLNDGLHNGVAMDPVYWTDPIPYDNGCVAPTAVAVPALSGWSMILLAGLLAAGWLFTRRRQRI